VRVERAQYFLAAVETGSFRAAAARCGISQPALGEQIALLEEELDVVLLIRSRRGVRPTPAGQALLEPLARLVAAQDSVRDAAMDARGSYRGRVWIGAGSVTAELLVAPVVGELRRLHPGLRFSVREGPSREIETAVRSGELDLAVITSPADPAPEGVRRVPLLTAPLGIVARRDHPLAGRPHLTWPDLEAWPVVTMRSGTVLWEVLRARLPSADVVVEAMSARTVEVMVARGAGVGILARLGNSADHPDLTWVPLRDTESLTVDLVERSGTRPSGSGLIVRRLLLASAGGLQSR
jgi:DNA-binding transcriptional LysR family regulator